MSRYYADDTEGIFWFLHLTDLHIDTDAPKAREHLEFALDEVVQVVDPIAVFATGDLVDGTILSIPTSGQDPAEWGIYATLLYDADMTPDFAPVMGTTPVAGFYLDAGWGTWGFKATPISGKTMAATIANGRDDPLIRAFNLSRFDDFSLVGEKGAASIGH